MKKHEKIKMGIGAKLAIAFILLIAIPLCVLGISSYEKSVKIMETNLKTSSLQLTYEIKDSINNLMKGFEESTIQMSDEANVQQAIATEDSVQWMMKSFQSFIKAHPDAESIYLGTENKDMFIFPNAQFDEGYDPTQRPWYQDAVGKNDLIWTDPYIDATTGKQIITVAKPVYNSFNGNEFVGVLAVDISLETLAEKVNAIQIGKRGYPVVLDRSLNIMTHKNKELIGKPTGVKELDEAVKEKNEGVIDYKREENGKMEQKFAAFTKLEKLGWTVFSAIYVDEIKEDLDGLLWNTLLIGIISLLIALFISYLFSKGLTKHIKLLLVDMERIKDGDLTILSDIKSKDEIGKLGEGFNAMIDEVGKLVKNVQTASREVSASAENLAATSEETSASAEEVAKTVEEIAKGATEQAADAEKGAMLTARLSNKFVELNNNTKEMLSSANEVMEANLDGIKVIGDLKNKTKLNSDATEKIEGAITELDSKTKYIGGILDTIASIAEQTNLLALNASIEAARAGEHGKGFAVVADEIRKLAEGSREAADEIKEIVINIQNDSNNTVQAMGEVKERSREQAYAVNEVNVSFDTISKSIDHIAGKIESISEYVNELNKDKDAIVGAIENISAVSEETAAASEEVSASMQQQSMAVEEVANASNKLNDLALKLNNEISRFKI
ncbi:methyl-accepting chemotaxis protein [Marinisporobacter balticus]|uniref:Methyl-accepting chemotaxis sensory transducer with Cache sensor n=1 Tax=Marinisporobacter balticus TaxID=2018667 RepID=A0A4R2L446_9FIRM|nr:methyl-accepting chemotaxis protein [Marinisporobacter balticus]TCO78729.1 methyl-accepting chemotaxis sensory transducer with Cache sensor [Marinisporobacter balticus]